MTKNKIDSYSPSTTSESFDPKSREWKLLTNVNAVEENNDEMSMMVSGLVMRVVVLVKREKMP